MLYLDSSHAMGCIQEEEHVGSSVLDHFLVAAAGAESEPSVFV
jgi:hypothetical protein